MSTKIKVAVLALLVGANVSFMAPEVFAQDTINEACTQWQQQKGLCTPGLRAMALTVINWFLLFTGLVTTAILIYGGFLYVTSAGNEENVGKAKKLIIYAGVGIILILLAAVISNALLSINQTAQTPQQQ